MDEKFVNNFSLSKPGVSEAADITYNPAEELFVAQSAKPAHLGVVNLRVLSPFLRALLVIDGTVTKFIEAYRMEPVEIVRLSQALRKLPGNHKWLDAPKGTPVIAREVLLKGKYSHRIYSYAVSLILFDRLPENIRKQFDIEGEGLGRILLNSRLESFREVLWYGRERLNQLPEEIQFLNGTDVISRTYRIFSSGRPIMLINEKFPTANDTDLY